MLINMVVNVVFFVLSYFSRGGVRTKKERRSIGFAASGIFLGMTLLFFVSASSIVMSALEGETNFDIMSSIIFPCEPLPVDRGERMAILRIDDIQAFAWSDVQQRMIADAFARGNTPVLGVIPKGLKSDADLYGFLRSNRCNVEIAQHGYDHVGPDGSGPEFAGVTEREAYRDIMTGKDIIETLSREEVVTFIPPENTQSADALRAIERAEIPVISSEGASRWDYHAATFDYDADVLVSTEAVLSECDEHFKSATACVIMLHPQDFVTANALDESKYAVYTSLLDELSKRGIEIVRFKDVYLQEAAESR